MTPWASTAWPCVNDIICGGAAPLFFLDYIACGKKLPRAHRGHRLRHHRGAAARRSVPLVGGETAEMPASTPRRRYDLAGFSVGLVDEGKIIDGRRLSEADMLIGLASSGVHSNGFSLVRKVFDVEHADLKRPVRIWAARAWARPCWPPPASM